MKPFCKSGALLLSLCVLLSATPVSAAAEPPLPDPEKSWADQAYEEDYALEGAGTPEDPYLIQSDWDLGFFAHLLQDGDEEYRNCSYEIPEETPELDMGAAVWESFGRVSGAETASFQGSFLGNGCTISNLRIPVDDVQFGGLFGRIEGAEIRDLCLDHVVFGGPDAVMETSPYGDYYPRFGALAGEAADAEISGIVVTDSSFEAENRITQSYQTVGGVIGFLNDSTLEDCTAEFAIDVRWNAEVGSNDYMAPNYGGIVGEGSDGRIAGCIADVFRFTFSQRSSSSSYPEVGGILGYTFGTQVIGCQAAVDIDFQGENTQPDIGGLVGMLSEQNAAVVNCSATGRITVDAAYTEPSDREGALVGGLIGRMGDFGSSVLENCYSDISYQEINNYYEADYDPGMLTGNLASTVYVQGDHNRRVTYGNFYLDRPFGEGGFLYPLIALPLLQTPETPHVTEEDNYAVRPAQGLVTGEWAAPILFRQAFSPADEDADAPRYPGQYVDVETHYDVSLRLAPSAAKGQADQITFGRSDTGSDNWILCTAPGSYPILVTVTRRADAEKSDLCSGISYAPLSFTLPVTVTGDPIPEPAPEPDPEPDPKPDPKPDPEPNPDPKPRPSTGGGSAGTSPVVTSKDGDAVLQPKTTTSNGTASVQVGSKEADALRQAAKRLDGSTLVIAPQVGHSANSVRVDLTKQAAESLAAEPSLTVQSGFANVVFPGQVLRDMAGRSQQSISIETSQESGGALSIQMKSDGRVLEQIPGGIQARIPVQNAGPGTVAVLLLPDGSEAVVKRSIQADGVLTVPLESSVRLRVEDRSPAFVDMQAHWSSEAVTFVTARNIFNGTSATTFTPDAPMTRGMLITALYRLENEPESPNATFPDVEADRYYTPAVSWAETQQIVNGLGNGRFGPELPITREQLAMILYRWSGAPATSEKALDFVDVDLVGTPARNAMIWAVETGILTGKDDRRLAPKDTATRAEAAVILTRVLTA